MNTVKFWRFCCPFQMGLTQPNPRSNSTLFKWMKSPVLTQTGSSPSSDRTAPFLGMVERQKQLPSGSVCVLSVLLWLPTNTQLKYLTGLSPWRRRLQLLT